jgi:hypothetical protein
MKSAIGVESSLGNKKVFREINRIRPKARMAIRNAWFDIGKDLKNEANTEIKRKPKGGKTYYIRMKSGNYRRHVASAPGETHANLSGALRKSVSWKVHGYYRMDFGYGFATGPSSRAPEYDHVIEDGFEFKDGRKILARPSIGNAVKKIQRNATNEFHRQIAREFKRVK